MNKTIKDKYKSIFSENFNNFKVTLFTLVKWILCSITCGLVIGLIGTGFHILLDLVTHTRISHPNLLFFLPLAGIIIVFSYHLVNESKNSGTNLVLSAIHSNKEVPIKVAPLIIISTLLTHLCGGSAGREGAALQVGGSIGNFIAKRLRFDEKDTKILIMCGMSACFSALFGTPIAAAVFSMEVISVGIMHYSALVPCVISAYLAGGIARYFKIHPTSYEVGEIVPLNLTSGAKFIVLAIIFALASMLFCVILHSTAKLFNKYIKNDYFRIIFAACLVILMRYLFNTTAYLGAGTDVISAGFLTQCAWYVFLLKMIFTAVTLGGGFKGGEIVPTLFIGATLGSFLAPIFGLPIGLCAACGMVSIFCGVTNCPLTSLILSIEMFGAGSMKFCFLCIALSYLLSGYYGLYNSQKIMYSKYKTEYINRQSH